MGFADRLKTLFRSRDPADAEFFDELGDLLVEGDLGATLAMETSEELKKNCRSKGLRGDSEIRSELKRLLGLMGREIRIEPDPGRLTVILMLGVNGVGKTTSTAKLAHLFGPKGREGQVVLAAGDTFRAAAIDQLKLHGTRLGIKVIAQGPGSDPAAVIFDAISAALSASASMVIADTAGRMHTRSDLLRELGKIDKVVASKVPGADIRRLLVIDATTGQNGLRQAETFHSAVPLDGLVLTKYDSTAKGGLVLSIAKNVGIGTAFIGSGEGYDDLSPFSLDAYLDDFLGIAR
jgi:fused signal recognition particle receptor